MGSETELRQMIETLLQHDVDFTLRIDLDDEEEPALDETGDCSEEEGDPCDQSFSQAEFARVFQTNPAFYHLLHEMARLHNTKQHDYCGAGYDPMANLRASEVLGVGAWKGTLIRMSDKWERIRNFARQETLAVKDESFVDTLLDLAVYALHVINLFKEAARAVDAPE